MKFQFLKQTLTAVAVCALATTAGATQIELNAVMYPEGRSIDVEFYATAQAPKAKIDASIEAKKGQSVIEIDFSGMKPAILFGGDVTCYLVWAVGTDGSVENLGELWVGDGSGEGKFQTPMKNFALMISADIFPGKRKPAERVVYVSQPAKDKKAKSTSFQFSNWGVQGAAQHESITTLEYKDPVAVELAQARKVMAIANGFGAAEYDAARMKQATQTLAQAENAFKGGDKKVTAEFSRRTVAHASDAIRETASKKAAEQAALDEARRKAEISSLESAKDRAAAEAERSALQAAKVSAELAEVEKQRALLAAETEALAAQKAAVEKERDELKARLEGALGQVSSTKATARGLVVNLGDILFDVNKATLKPATQQTVAKLAGILLMMPGMNVRVEGHTDSTGKEEANLKLSAARAKAVYDLLAKHGIPAERLASQGYGPKIPVADNATKEGRAQNRRVEVVINEGAIQGAEVPAAK